MKAVRRRHATPDEIRRAARLGKQDAAEPESIVVLVTPSEDAKPTPQAGMAHRRAH